MPVLLDRHRHRAASPGCGQRQAELRALRRLSSTRDRCGCRDAQREERKSEAAVVARHDVTCGLQPDQGTGSSMRGSTSPGGCSASTSLWKLRPTKENFIDAQDCGISGMVYSIDGGRSTAFRRSARHHSAERRPGTAKRRVVARDRLLARRSRPFIENP